MRHKLVIDGNAVYEIDDDCLNCRQNMQGGQESRPHRYGEAEGKTRGKVRRTEGTEGWMNKNTQKP